MGFQSLQYVLAYYKNKMRFAEASKTQHIKEREYCVYE